MQVYYTVYIYTFVPLYIHTLYTIYILLHPIHSILLHYTHTSHYIILYHTLYYTLHIETKAAHAIDAARSIGAETFSQPHDLCTSNNKLNMIFVSQVYTAHPELDEPEETVCIVLYTIYLYISYYYTLTFYMYYTINILYYPHTIYHALYILLYTYPLYMYTRYISSVHILTIYYILLQYK